MSFLFLSILVIDVTAASFVVTRNDDRNAVCNPGDCSLREAVNAAAASTTDDIITFAPTSTNIVLTNELMVTAPNGSITIDGPGPAALKIDGGTGANGIFWLVNAVVTIRNLSLTGGFGGKFYTGGGAILVAGGTVVLDRIHAFGNQTYGSGGAVFYQGGSGHRILNSTFNNNTARNCGGFYNDRATVSVVNSTFTSNVVVSVGGGFCNDGTTTVRNITVTGNTAELGGGVHVSSGQFSFANSVIAGNMATKDYPEFLVDSLNIVFAGNNLIGDSPGDAENTYSTITYPPSDLLDMAPLLGPLQNNGGPTPTRMPLAGSPLIDAGNNNRAFDPFNNSPLLTDQRGATRIANRTVDIGAVETGAAIINRAKSFDFDGDNKTDIGIFRPAGSASEWWVNRSGSGQTLALQFGTSTDMIAPADYTGDGKTDIAFFRPASGDWYVLRSEDLSFFALPFGATGDVPVPSDYDADGKADFAVYRPSSSTWFISQSSGAPTRIEGFGIAGDVPVVADYDGDNKADVGIFRNNAGVAEWWINRSTAGVLAMQFGTSTDKPVQGDYTGDGKADIAIWRPASGEWLIVRSEDSSFYGFPFGANSDVPSPGDYDGDGKFDPTVFRPSSATWFSGRTTAGTLIVQFGATGDRPIPNAFVP